MHRFSGWIFFLMSFYGAAQVPGIDASKYPSGSIIYCIESNGVCYYYVSTIVNLVFKGSERFHTSIIIDAECDLLDVEVVEIRDEVTDGNDYEPDMLFQCDGIFIEYMNFRNWEKEVILGLFHFYNTEFEYLRTDTLSMSVNGWYPIQRDDKFQFVGFKGYPPPHQIVISEFFKLDSSVSTISLQNNLTFISSMLYIDSLNQYLVYHVSGLGKMDSLFNVIENIHATFAKTSVLGQLEFQNDRIISFGARLPPGISKWQVTFNSYDLNLTLLSDETYGDTSEADYPFIKECLQKRNGSIFTGATLDIDANGEPYATSSEPVEFVITKYDENRNQIWRYNYGGDAAYGMYGVKATPDGGCVAYGNRRDDEDGLRYPFMLKIDKDGLTTALKDLPDLAHAFTLYGNPVAEELRIHAEFSYPAAYRLTLTDPLGHIALEREMTQGMNAYRIAHLTPGIYYYSIVDLDRNRIVESSAIYVSR